jgi:hypothetical protein
VARYVVELYWPDVTTEQVSELLVRADRAARRMSDGDTQVRYLGCTLTIGDEVCFVRFEAASADAVGRVCEDAGILPGRLWEAVELTGGPSSDQ